MKRVSTIAYAPPQSGSTNTGGKDAFIFSSDIEDWGTPKSILQKRENKEKQPKGPGRKTRADHLREEDL